jgi:hypothetical protein
LCRGGCPRCGSDKQLRKIDALPIEIVPSVTITDQWVIVILVVVGIVVVVLRTKGAITDGAIDVVVNIVNVMMEK